jgi:hypothetical protein
VRGGSYRDQNSGVLGLGHFIQEPANQRLPKPSLFSWKELPQSPDFERSVCPSLQVHQWSALCDSRPQHEKPMDNSVPHIHYRGSRSLRLYLLEVLLQYFSTRAPNPIANNRSSQGRQTARLRTLIQRSRIHCFRYGPGCPATFPTSDILPARWL